MSTTAYEYGKLSSINVIRHAYHDIDIYLRCFKDSDLEYRKVQFEVSWDIIKKLQKDIQRLCINMNEKKTVYILVCTTLQDLQDLVNC